jgi:hypothetical protein
MLQSIRQTCPKYISPYSTAPGQMRNVSQGQWLSIANDTFVLSICTTHYLIKCELHSRQINVRHDLGDHTFRSDSQWSSVLKLRNFTAIRKGDVWWVITANPVIWEMWRNLQTAVRWLVIQWPFRLLFDAEINSRKFLHDEEEFII